MNAGRTGGLCGCRTGNGDEPVKQGGFGVCPHEAGESSARPEQIRRASEEYGVPEEAEWHRRGHSGSGGRLGDKTEELSKTRLRNGVAAIVTEYQHGWSKAMRKL